MDETEAHARTHDPATAHEAAAIVRRSRLEAQAVAGLSEHYPRAMSSTELAMVIGVPRDSISPRMRPLQRKGLVECVEAQPSVSAGGKVRTMLAWRATQRFAIKVEGPKARQMDLFKEDDDDMGRRSDFKRRPHDFYQTIDSRAVTVLKPFLPGITTFAEPCCGRGELVKWLEVVGLRCVQYSDIVMGTDALEVSDFNNAQVIITNPPWTRKLLHPLIKHFQKHRPTWLLMDSDWAYNTSATPYLDQCSDIVAIGRLKWMEGTRQTGKDNASWYCFWHQHKGGPRFHGRTPAPASPHRGEGGAGKKP